MAAVLLRIDMADRLQPLTNRGQAGPAADTPVEQLLQLAVACHLPFQPRL